MSVSIYIVIFVYNAGPVQGPEVGEPPLMDVQQKLGSTLRLSCKIKYQTTPETKFRWQKDGQEIRSEDGVSIRSKGYEMLRYIIIYCFPVGKC